MTPRSRRLLGIVVLLALVGPIVIDLLWVTDEERVERTLDAFEEALEARDADAVIAWFAEDVTVERPIPNFPNRATLAEGVRLFLAQLSRFSFQRSSTQLHFTDEGDADVTIEGHGSCEFADRGPMGLKEGWFRFEVQEMKLRRDGDRYLLQSIGRVLVKPPIG